MGWKIGTIALGVTTLGLVVWDMVLLMTVMHQECQNQIQKNKNDGLKAVMDIQNEYLNQKN